MTKSRAASPGPRPKAAKHSFDAGRPDLPQPPPPNAASYSGVVRLLKIALPLSALAILLTMVIFSFVFQPEGSVAISYSDIARDDGKIVMTDPRFIGSDAEGRSFEVIAARAFQNVDITTLITLEDVVADMVLETGVRISLAAKQGELDTRNELLALSGPITLKSSDGYDIRTSEVKVDLARGALAGHNPIEAEGPFGTLYADGFEVDRNDKRLRFLGNVRIQIVPKASENQ